MAGYFIDNLVMAAFDVFFECAQEIFSPTKEQMKRYIVAVFERLPSHFQSLFDKKKVDKIA